MTRQPPPDRPPTIIEARLPGHVCEPLWRGLRDHLAERTRNGGQVRPEIAEALTVLRATALAYLSGQQHEGSDTRASEHPEALTVREMAERMGCSTQWVRHLLNTGRLAGRKSGRVWIVHPNTK